MIRSSSLLKPFNLPSPSWFYFVEELGFWFPEVTRDGGPWVLERRRIGRHTNLNQGSKIPCLILCPLPYSEASNDFFFFFFIEDRIWTRTYERESETFFSRQNTYLSPVHRFFTLFGGQRSVVPWLQKLGCIECSLSQDSC